MSYVYPTILWFVSELETEMRGGGKVPSSKRSSIVNPLLKRFKSIGWRDSVLKERFSNLSDSMIPRDEYEFYYDDDIINGFTNIWYNRRGFDTSIKKTLKNMGLSAPIARHLNTLYSTLRNTSYTDEQLIGLAIQHQMGRFKPITPPNTVHYYRSDVLNTWVPFQSTQCFNIPHPCSKSLYEQYSPVLDLLPHNLQQKQYFFHATNWKGCLSILEAIQHNGPSRCLDFGLNPGFYISPSFKHTLEWGQKRSGGFSNEVAIVVFSIPKKIPSRFKYIKLEGNEWRSVVVESRLCTDDMYKRLPVDKVDFVYGPMLANPNDVKNGAEPKMHAPPKYQLVSKSDAADKFLQTCIVGCLFFQKGWGDNPQS